jgi:AcrR family transcriptional regulator
MAARTARPQLKSRLLDAAWELFATSGYDGTTIERIIDRVGVSKGAFYHYFSSKEEVLDAVIERMIARGFDAVAPLLSSRSLSAVEKLNAFLAESRKWRMANIGTVLAVADVLLRDENIIIRHKTDRQFIARAQPILSQIILQGVHEGLFDVTDSDESSLLLLNLMNLFAETQSRTLLQVGQIPQKLGILQRRAKFFVDCIERILGAPRGSIEPVGQDVFQAASRAIQHSQEAGREGSHVSSGRRDD